jgi:hypothetical protein
MRVTISNSVTYVPHEDGEQGMLFDEEHNTLVLLNRTGRYAWESMVEGEWSDVLRAYYRRLGLGEQYLHRSVAEDLEQFVRRCAAQGWAEVEHR